MVFIGKKKNHGFSYREMIGLNPFITGPWSANWPGGWGEEGGGKKNK